MRFLILAALALVWNSGNCFAGEKLDLASEQAKISYSIGYQVGGDLKMQKIAVRQEMLLKGIQDALAGSEPQLTPEQMRDSLIELKKRADAAQQKQ